MLRCYVDDRRQDWEAYSSTLTDVYDRQVYHSKNTHPFHLVLDRRIPGFTLEFTVSKKKMITAAEQQAPFLAILQH